MKLRQKVCIAGFRIMDECLGIIGKRKRQVPDGKESREGKRTDRGLKERWLTYNFVSAISNEKEHVNFSSRGFGLPTFHFVVLYNRMLRNISLNID